MHKSGSVKTIAGPGRSSLCGLSGSERHLAAFTLVELLVVIAIIGLLAAMVVPALRRAKDKGEAARCLGNLRQLQASWHLYALDNQDVVSPNDCLNFGAATLVDGPSWCQGDARVDTTYANIEKGLLFPYTRSRSIYHCPSDRSVTEGAVPGLLRNRSYNMSQSVNGYPQYLDRYDYPTEMLSYQRLSAVRTPGLANLFVFIDEHPDTLYDACFSHAVDIPIYMFPHWYDMPADRHNQGAVLSFADGHVERWRWRSPMTFMHLFAQASPHQVPDYYRIQAAMKRTTD